MPKRMVDGEGVWRSQKLRQVELKYRSEYANMLPLAGDRGTFECDPASIWADVFAYNRPDITPEDVESILADFERVKLLFRWQQDGKSWGYWVGIEKAGLLPKPSERYSKEPIPDADELTRFSSVSGAGDPRADRAQAAPLPRTGLGLGVGSGVGLGLGIGESNSNSAAQRGSSSPDGDKNLENQDQKQNQKPSAMETAILYPCASLQGFRSLPRPCKLLQALFLSPLKRLASARRH